MSCLPTEIDSAEPVPAHGDTPVRVGCAPRERSCCFLLSWKFQLCSGTALRPTPGGEAVRCGNPWNFCGGNLYIQRNWKMVFAISGLHKVRPYSLPLSPFAISIPGLCGKCCCAVKCKQRAALQGWSRAVFGCYNRIWCPGTCSPGLGSHVQPTVCHMEPTWRMQEEEEKKFGASAKQMPSAGLQEAVWPGNCSWLNWPSGCACLLWPTSTNCCGTLEVPWSSVTGAVSSALQLCGEDLKPHSS